MDELTNTSSCLPEEYKVIMRIRDLWSNHVSDDEIRELLQISTNQWELLMRTMKEISFTEGDNRIAFEKYLARQQKRTQELKRLRIYAEGQEELGTAVKCFQLESDIDKSVIEMGLKLSVLKGEIIQTEVNVKHDVRLAAIFANLSPEQASAAQAELNSLTQELLAEGIKLTNDPVAGTGEGTTK